MNFKPVQDKVLIKPDEPVKQIGMIALNGSNNDKNIIGTVIAIGAGNYNENGVITPVNLKINQKVCFPKTSGVELELDNQKYLIVKESDIHVILE